MSPVMHPAELWTLMHGPDAVRCIATPHPLGVELRYLINEHPLIARVLSDWSHVRDVANTWRSRLEASGWAAPSRGRSARRQ
jgi:hypothetical protein